MNYTITERTDPQPEAVPATAMDPGTFFRGRSTGRLYLRLVGSVVCMTPTAGNTCQPLSGGGICGFPVEVEIVVNG